MEKVEHVLIVDDDRDIRELIGTYLQKNGARVSKASGGREMWAVLATEPPDIIVLDITLPGENGLALCRELRAGQWRTIPILMLTALSDETDRVVGLVAAVEPFDLGTCLDLPHHGEQPVADHALRQRVDRPVGLRRLRRGEEVEDVTDIVRHQGAGHCVAPCTAFDDS